MLQIETERLIIRDHRTDDIQDYFSLISNEEEMFYLPDLYTAKLNKTTELLTLSIDEAHLGEKRKKYFLGVFLKNGTYIGEIGYTVTSQDNRGHKNVQMGYFTKKAFWGNGFITEAAKGLLNFAYNKDNVIKIEIGCLTDNIASEKVMKKCGFTQEGYKPKNQYLKGKWRDRVEYGLLKEDYLQ
jgi:RimJ/RimL family protein N-acetyltransferase